MVVVTDIGDPTFGTHQKGEPQNILATAESMLTTLSRGGSQGSRPSRHDFPEAQVVVTVLAVSQQV